MRHKRRSITLGEESYLELLPDPLIPHRRARYLSNTRICVPTSATLLFSEIIQPGRKHHHPDECFGATLLSIAATASRPDGRLLFTEKLIIEPQRYSMRQTGVMDSFDVFGNVILCTPKDKAELHLFARTCRCRPLTRCGFWRLPATQRCWPHLQGRRQGVRTGERRRFASFGALFARR